MRRPVYTLLWLVWLVGCAAPGQDGALTVEVGSWVASIAEPEVSSGWSEVAFVLVDGDGEPVPDLDVVADLWMPAHGHGTTDEVTVQETAAGQYEIRGNYIMPGQWEVTAVLRDDVPDLVFLVEAVSE